MLLTLSLRLDEGRVLELRLSLHGADRRHILAPRAINQKQQQSPHCLATCTSTAASHAFEATSLRIYEWCMEIHVLCHLSVKVLPRSSPEW